MILFVDSDMGVPFSFGFTDQWNYKEQFTEKFIDSITRFGIPSEILVRRRETYEILEIMADQLDIRLTPVEKLPKMEYVQDFVLGRLV